MTEFRPARRVLLLGGGGMVGLQVAREIARNLRPETIVISALYQNEVDEAVAVLSEEASSLGWDVSFKGEAGDIFLPSTLQGHSRAELLENRELFDQLFDDVFSSDPDAWSRSEMVRLIRDHQPDVIVDCINTATAISYQDVYTSSKRIKYLLDRLEEKRVIDEASVTPFVSAIRELVVAQGVPQIVRHILFLQKALDDSSVRVYVKVGTTGTGGMGVNIPYTHSEEKPSPTLLSKSAIGFAHTGLLFLLARTPGSAGASGKSSHGTMIKEIKPGAMIGFRRLGRAHVRLNGPSGMREPGYLYGQKQERIGPKLEPRQSWSEYEDADGRRTPIEMVGADTGENGFFSIGEFEAITYPRQMEYVTPEEVARTVVLEILGSSTGRDVIAAIDGAITEPSYRAGLLRHQAKLELDRLEALFSSDENLFPSMPVGHLGPPQLTKLLTEAWLIRTACGTSRVDELVAIDAEEMRLAVEKWLEANPRVSRLITTVGLPILREDDEGLVVTRGPRLNIPVPSPDGQPLPTEGNVERWSEKGWVDLRRSSFRHWRQRIERIVDAAPDIAGRGSASFDLQNYLPDEFRPGEVVGWLLANEPDDSGMVGHRIL